MSKKTKIICGPTLNKLLLIYFLNPLIPGIFKFYVIKHISLFIKQKIAWLLIIKIK